MGKAKRIRRQRIAEEDAYQLTSRQEMIMFEEVNKVVMAEDAKFWLDMDAAVLLVLSKTLGFGRVRLLRFHEEFYKIHEELRRYYELPQGGKTSAFLAWEFLKKYGITKEFLLDYDKKLYEKYVEAEND